MTGTGASEVAGVVLAAGQSERMGEPKPLLELADGRTFLEAAVAALREGGCGDVVVVVGSPNTAFAARSAGGRIAQGAPDGEQIESLRGGLDELGGGVACAAVLPVDHPTVRGPTVAALIEAWRDDPDAVVRPVYDDAPGHPTLFPREVWPALRSPTLEGGARSVVESSRVVDVPVDDPGVVTDVDTPGDLEGLDG